MLYIHAIYTHAISLGCLLNIVILIMISSDYHIRLYIIYLSILILYV